MDPLSTPKPIISLIVPTYNSAAFIDETLHAIMAQQHRDLEIIVVDDHSSDDTCDIVLAMNDARIKCVRLKQNHGGPSRPRNIGATLAQGKYVCFCDSDDQLQPWMIAQSIEFLEMSPELGLCFWNVVKFDDHTRIEQPPFLASYPDFHRLPKKQVAEKWFVIESRHAYHALFFANFILTPGCVVVPRRVFQQVGWFDDTLKNGDDRDMWLRIAKRYPIGYIDDIGLRYRERAGSISKRGAVSAQYRVKMLQKHLCADHPPHVRRQIRKRIAENYNSAAYAFQAKGESAEARQHYWKGILSFPTRSGIKGLAVSLLGTRPLRLLKQWLRDHPSRTK